jgi:hypothetical protein
MLTALTAAVYEWKRIQKTLELRKNNCSWILPQAKELRILRYTYKVPGQCAGAMRPVGSCLHPFADKRAANFEKFKIQLA